MASVWSDDEEGVPASGGGGRRTAVAGPVRHLSHGTLPEPPGAGLDTAVPSPVEGAVVSGPRPAD